ncbi:MAG TPA: replication-relaxation family protein, partial [Gemmatimonadaceae bacterium]|nr:replication-relaxation family protein [Gemmatimonadaceae bacterium]
TTKKHRILPRDIEAFALVGRFRMLTRQQLKGWLFADVSETIVTRFFDRATERCYLGVERLHGNGIQVCWLTKKGRDFLVEGGYAPAADLFPAIGPVPAKDFAHTVEIVNAALAMRRRTPAPDELLPAWMVQRMFAGKLTVWPDLLCLWKPHASDPGAALAIEVDLGGEPVKTVVVPKTLELIAFLDASASRGVAAILLLTCTPRRRDSLYKILAPAVGDFPLVIELLAALSGEAPKP